ncbi:polyprenyl synthetase family protein [Streptomyces sp. NPDC090442]|uniref:polyprenyl synthetase family protein n=1 Tax=Streptomyces sp. NPDC090442 TaxID=3365962 RepID=UPI0037FD16F1
MPDEMSSLPGPRLGAVRVGGPQPLPAGVRDAADLPRHDGQHPPAASAEPPRRDGPVDAGAVRTAAMVEATAALHEGLGRLCPDTPGPALSAELMGREGVVPSDDADSTQRDRRLHAALISPVRHLLDAGGKRWRAHLMARVLEIYGVSPHHYAELIAACEMGHAGSLMVDDVEDTSPVRRGSPAAHMLFGEATAINAGTAAYFSVDRAIRRCFPGDAELRLAVYETYLANLRATHAGQALDIQGHQREMTAALATGDPEPLLNMLTLTHRLKTGAQVRAVCEIASLAGHATPQQRSALGEFGEAVGLAYQITDDVSDLRGVIHRDRATKRVAEDLHNAKVTFPLAHTVTLLPRDEAESLWRTLQAEPDEGAVRRAARTIDASGAVQRCEEQATALLDQAWTAVRPYLPDSPHTTALAEAATAVVHRTWNT